MDDVQKLNSRILEKDQEIAKLKSMVANLKISKKLTTDQTNDLSILDEKIGKHEQDLVKLNKEVEPWVRTRVENVLQYARELEAKYKILKKPLDTILRDIVFKLKFMGVAEGGEEEIYDAFPKKYKGNYTKSQMLYDRYGK